MSYWVQVDSVTGIQLQSQPYLSVLITAYNRGHTIARAIDSCLRQDYTDFELVIVEDGSTDNTAEVIQSYDDPRIRFIELQENIGMGGSRKLALNAANGIWAVELDSDDELSEGALSTIADLSRRVPGRIGRMCFMQRDINGEYSPQPAFTEQEFDYAGFIRWYGNLNERFDHTKVTRVSTRDKVSYLDGRGSTHLEHLDMAKAYNLMSFPIIVTIRHFDAGNQMGFRISPSLMKKTAPNLSPCIEVLIDRHGSAMLEIEPEVWRRFKRYAAVYAYLAGDRTAGDKHVDDIRNTIGSSSLLNGLAMAGRLGPGVLAGAITVRRKFRRT